MKSQLPRWCALAPFQLHTSSLSCRGLEFGSCFSLVFSELVAVAMSAVLLERKKKDKKEPVQAFTVSGAGG